jgi:phage baseplate assembly protein W
MAKIFSAEDGNLSTSVRVVRDRLYSDFDLTFEANTTSGGDVYSKTDAASVKQAIKTLLLTNRFEKPYRPQFGADLGGLLFNLADADTGEEISSALKTLIS